MDKNYESKNYYFLDFEENYLSRHLLMLLESEILVSYFIYHMLFIVRIQV